MRSPLSSIWRLLKILGTWLIVLLILFEEWGWVPLVRMMGLIARLPMVGWLERRIAALPPRMAVVVLFVPALLLLPAKIFAWWLVGRGKLISGIVILVAAKVFGTAVVARIFMLTRPQLMRLPWFARWYVRWTAWKTGLIARLSVTPGWQAAAAAMGRVRAFWSGL